MCNVARAPSKRVCSWNTDSNTVRICVTTKRTSTCLHEFGAQRGTKAFLEHVPTRSALGSGNCRTTLADTGGHWSLHAAAAHRTSTTPPAVAERNEVSRRSLGGSFLRRDARWESGSWMTSTNYTWEHCKFHSNSRNAIDVERGHWQGISKLLRCQNMLKTL